MYAVHAPSKSILVHADDPFALCAAMPNHTKLLGPTPDGNVAVRHTLETTRVLRNLGYDVPAPIITQYDWSRGRYPPLPHQKVMADFMVSNPKSFNLSGMGAMKSKAALWAADYLMSIGAVHRCLIVSTLSTLETVWRKEIFETVTHRSCAIVHGSVKKREKALNQHVDFYIVNHDGLALENVYMTVRRRTDIDLILVDELGFFRNEDTDKWKFLNWILEKKRWFWGMTGTPCPNEPTDAWALCRLVDPTRVPKYKGAFRRDTMYEVDRFRWKPRKGYEQIVYKALQPAIRFQKADVIDLPPVTVIEHQTRLTHEQEAAFKTMRDEMVMEMESGVRITAVNAADKVTKLHQALCIAKDTPVLTIRGWVPIQDVEHDDLVWDGEEWVAHDGVVDNGIRECMKSDEIWMTPNHSVLTVAGWRTAHEQSRYRLDRHPVRLPDGPRASGIDADWARQDIGQSDVAVGDGEATSQQSQVFDIVNCGPRNRFVVRGADGQALIVHNCGSTRDPVTGEYHLLPHRPRVNDLCEIIDSASAKVICVVPYKGILRSLAEDLTKRGYLVGVLNGDVPTAQRVKIIDVFKSTPKGQAVDILLCHPAVMAHGLNLTEADTLIFYSAIRGNDAYRQVLERFNRVGQTRSMTVVRMAAHPLEWGMYKVLDHRGEMQDNILALYHQVVIRGLNEYVTHQ